MIPAERIKPRTLSLPKAKRHAARPETLPPAELVEHPRPRTRAECADVPRPCPYVSCRHHLYLEALPNGSLKVNFPSIGPEDMPAHLSCSLDVAERGDRTLESVAELMNLTKERVRQLELEGKAKLVGPLAPHHTGEELDGEEEDGELVPWDEVH